MRDNAASRKSAVGRLLGPRALFVYAAATLYLAALQPSYPGSIQSILAFSIAAGCLVLVAAICSPGFFSIAVAAFLTLGFPLKLFLHLAFGIQLIEVTGQFDGSAATWDRAIWLSAAGLAGSAAAMFLPTLLGGGKEATVNSTETLRPAPLLAVSISVLIGAIVTYSLNASFDILRIGYAPKVDLPFPLYPVLAFTISWGAILAGLTITWWFVERGRLHPSSLLYVATAIGFAASFTMGSRAQLLLYLLAAVFAASTAPGASLWRQFSGPRTLRALVIAFVVFALSLTAVSLTRSLNFTPATAPNHQDLINSRLPTILSEIGNLFVMRWVGLEGALTAAGAADQQGIRLLLEATTDDPAKGTEGLYQRLAGSPYRHIESFTFLTLAGPIGLAALSGSPIVVAGVMFMLVLIGISIEAISRVLVRNAGTSAVCGVSLAYLLVQMNVPWTLLVFAIELVGAILVLTLVRYAIFVRPARTLQQ